MSTASAQTAVLSVTRRVRSTPFTPRVEALGVKGYSVYNHTLLPTHFTSVVEDYRHLKRHVQIWDVSCERQVELQGPDAARLAQLMTPRNLSGATVGRCLYAPLIDVRAGMLNDPVLLKLAEDRFWLSLADSDILLWAKGLAFGLGLEVEVFEPEVTPLAVQGPKAEALMARVFGEAVRAIRFFRFAALPFQGHPLVVARSGWSKQGGFEIYLDRPELGLPLWDALWDAGQDLEVAPGSPNGIERIEGALLSYGSDMTRENNPLECDLERYCALDAPIEFIGRDALRRIRDEGVARKIRGLRIETDSLPPCTGLWPVSGGGSLAGQVSSAAVSPDLGCGIALAMLDQGYWESGTRVTVAAPDGPRPATVCDLPFVVPAG